MLEYYHMILTGNAIRDEFRTGDIMISPYFDEFVEQNAYCVHLGPTIVEYDCLSVDARSENTTIRRDIPEEGLLLYPERFYLGHTQEIIGGKTYASELYANLSTALCGMFIQTSAPLGHVGAVISWTLEIVVAHPVVVYSGMPIGKVCFWRNAGTRTPYEGRYLNSNTVVPSRIGLDQR
jgi:dCTP deaminase